MTWYTAEELRTYLYLQNYSDEIIKELAEIYAKNLQLAFEKGQSMARETCVKVLDDKHDEFSKRSYPAPKILLELADEMRELKF